jgi:hypothetical protein
VQPDNADRIKESVKCLDNIKCHNLIQGVLFCVAGLPQSYWKKPCKKAMAVSLLHFFSLEMNKCIVQKCMYTVYKCIVYVQYIYTLQVHMSADGVVIHYIG